MAIASALLLFMGLGVILPSPAFLNPKELPMGWVNNRYYGQKVATLEAAYKKREIDPDSSIGFILGQSNVRENFDPEIVSSLGGHGVRWVVLSGSGGSFVKMEYLSRPLFLSRIQPTVAVLGFAPTMLIGQPNPARSNHHRSGRGLKERSSDNPNAGLERLLDKEWIISKRRVMNDVLKHGLYRIRLRLFHVFGVGPEALFRPHPDINPFGADPKHYRTPRAPEKHWKRQMAFWKTFGWFDPRKYRTDSDQARALIRLIENFKEIGAEVFILLMPEAQKLRTLEPVEAVQTLQAVLENAFPADTIPVIDMRDSMSEEYFYDFGHLNWAGRKLFSHRFAETIEPYLEQYQVVPKP
jgi:hypothetical protein